MTHGFKGERTLMRIHVGGNDRWDHKPLFEAIVELLRKEGFAGATAFRGMLGYGATAAKHKTSFFGLSRDQPIVVECVETDERIQAILPVVDKMIDGGLITLEKVRVIMYRPHLPEAERTGSWPIALGQ